jgi:hypothetical protein
MAAMPVFMSDKCYPANASGGSLRVGKKSGGPGARRSRHRTRNLSLNDSFVVQATCIPPAEGCDYVRDIET